VIVATQQKNSTVRCLNVYMCVCVCVCVVYAELLKAATAVVAAAVVVVLNCHSICNTSIVIAVCVCRSVHKCLCVL
jgi:hypothetical protein